MNETSLTSTSKELFLRVASLSLVAENGKRFLAVMYPIIDSLCYNYKPVTQRNYPIRQDKPETVGV